MPLSWGVTLNGAADNREKVLYFPLQSFPSEERGPDDVAVDQLFPLPLSHASLE